MTKCSSSEVFPRGADGDTDGGSGVARDLSDTVGDNEAGVVAETPGIYGFPKLTCQES